AEAGAIFRVGRGRSGTARERAEPDETYYCPPSPATAHDHLRTRARPPTAGWASARLRQTNGQSTMSKTSPSSTACPCVTAMLETLPPAGDSTGISIFIDSSTTSVCPSDTDSPTPTRISHTVPVMWAATSVAMRSILILEGGVRGSFSSAVQMKTRYERATSTAASWHVGSGSPGRIEPGPAGSRCHFGRLSLV